MIARRIERTRVIAVTPTTAGDQEVTYTVTNAASGSAEQTFTISVALVCAAGGAVPNPASNPDLVCDCETLLAVKDVLRGPGTLNWSAITAITSWDGLTVPGTPSRVIRLSLDKRSLTGNIPADLAALSELRALWLHDNQLSGAIHSQLGGLARLQTLALSGNRLIGAIPSDLSELTNLKTLHLRGNQFTGCIPPALRDVCRNDLDSVGLPDSAAPADS